MKQLINTINEDPTIITLLGQDHVHLNNTTDTNNCLLIEYHTVGGDRLKKQVRLTCTAIADTMTLAEAIETRLNEIILSFGDNPVNDNILQSSINGGGVLYDSARQKNHKIIYYNLTLRGVE